MGKTEKKDVHFQYIKARVCNDKRNKLKDCGLHGKRAYFTNSYKRKSQVITCYNNLIYYLIFTTIIYINITFQSFTT